MLTADADGVSFLLNGRVGGDLLRLCRVAVLIHLDDAVNMDLVGGAARERDGSRAGGDRKIQLAVERQVAIEGGFGLRGRCQPQRAARQEWARCERISGSWEG